MPTSDEMRLFARRWRDNMKRIADRRDADRRKAYLTPEMLRKRRSLTAGGRKKLVLDFGYKGATKAYSLAQLDEMARRLEKAQGTFKAEVGGILAAQIVSHSTPGDKHRAKEIRRAMLFKVKGETLSFHVTASGETPGAPDEYQVRIRLHDWHRAVTKSQGKKYFGAAKDAVSGLLSFDCSCDRYRYHYHYLATIGGFDIEPGEHVFPKIRNPGLTGCACKHVLKTLMVLHSPTIIQRVSGFMEHEAGNKSLTVRRAKYLGDEDLLATGKAGEKASATKAAFQKFLVNLKAFKERLNSPVVVRKVKEHEKKMQAKLKQKTAEAKRSGDNVKRLALARVRDMAMYSKQLGVPFKDLAEKSAKANPGLGTADDLMAIAREAKLI